MLNKLKDEFRILDKLISDINNPSISLVCDILGGHNLDFSDRYFDLNFGSACYTIYQYEDKYEIGETIEVYKKDGLFDRTISKYDLFEETKMFNKELFIDALNQFKDASYKLLVAWENVDLGLFPRSMKMYPFNEDYKYVYDSIFQWVYETVKELQSPPKPDQYEILKSIYGKDYNAYIEVKGIEGRFKGKLGLAAPTLNNMAQLWIGDDTGKDDCKISAEEFNKEFMVYRVHWSDEIVNV